MEGFPPAAATSQRKESAASLLTPSCQLRFKLADEPLDHRHRDRGIYVRSNARGSYELEALSPPIVANDLGLLELPRHHRISKETAGLHGTVEFHVPSSLRRSPPLS